MSRSNAEETIGILWAILAVEAMESDLSLLVGVSAFMALVSGAAAVFHAVKERRVLPKRW